MKHLKILGLLLLALVGVMAVSASAAQAEWLILLEEKEGVFKSVESITLSVEGLPGEFLVTPLGLKIKCTGGTGTVTGTLSNAKKTLTGKGEVTFEGCVVLGNETNCTVEGPGKGKILAKGSGTATMPAKPSKDVTALLSSAEFAFVKISGALCPLNETEAAINGSVNLTLLDPSVEAFVQLADIDEEELFYGNEKAVLHPVGSEVGGVEAHLKDIDPKRWAISLVGSL